MWGAENLLGRGDMLYIPVGMSKPVRVQGAFLSDEEVERVVAHCIGEQEVAYQEEMIPSEVAEITSEAEDELYGEAVQLITEMKTASICMLHRRFRIEYTREIRLKDESDVVGGFG